MAIKTLKFYGQGYGTVPCTIVATLNGNEVFNGAIATIEPQYVDRSPESQVELFTAEIDTATVGLLPMSIQVTAGDGAYFMQVMSNYIKVVNPVYTTAQLNTLLNPATTDPEKTVIYEQHANPALTAEEIALLQQVSSDENGAAKLAVLESHGLTLMVNGGAGTFGTPAPGSDIRENVAVDGTPVEPPVRPPYGTYGWFVHSGSTLSCDLVITN